MVLEIVLLMQAAASLPPETIPQYKLDLHDALTPDPCGTSDGDEIVVCGRKVDPEHFRLRPFTQLSPHIAAMPKAEIKIFGTSKLGIEGETVTVGGAPSNRAMVKLKVPF